MIDLLEEWGGGLILRTMINVQLIKKKSLILIFFDNGDREVTDSFTVKAICRLKRVEPPSVLSHRFLSVLWTM